MSQSLEELSDERVFPDVEIVVTPELKLRTIQPNDFLELCQLARSQRRYIDSYSTNRLERHASLEDIEEDFADPSALVHDKPFLKFGIWENDMLVGFSFLVMNDPERLRIGCWIAQGRSGNGLATKTTKALLEYGLIVYGVYVVVATVKQDNTASIKTLLKCGFEQTDEFEDGDDYYVFEFCQEDFPPFSES